MDDSGPFELLTDLVVGRRPVDRPFVAGITGSVAVGKSTLATRLGAALSERLPGAAVEVVSTDSFLFPNRVLDARGLTMRKGFPESFDRDRLAGFLEAVRRRAPGQSVPVYDHFTYDIVDGAESRIDEPDVLIIEGLALLGTARIEELLDVSVFVDADVADIEAWYVHRFVRHALRAVEEPGGFWDLFAGLDEGQLREAAAFTWNAINLPNLVDHIAPTKPRADLVATKSPNHTISEIRVQEPDRNDGS